jgi:hypothetical protein
MLGYLCYVVKAFKAAGIRITFSESHNDFLATLERDAAKRVCY